MIRESRQAKVHTDHSVCDPSVESYGKYSDHQGGSGMAMDNDGIHFFDDDGAGDESGSNRQARPMRLVCQGQRPVGRTVVCVIRLDQDSEVEFRCDGYECRAD